MGVSCTREIIAWAGLITKTKIMSKIDFDCNSNTLEQLQARCKRHYEMWNQYDPGCSRDLITESMACVVVVFVGGDDI